MAINPLQQYFRQPKIFVNLPSHGAYYQPGLIQGDINNLPVHGMTGMDEIIIKTPDALFSGEASVKVIESCCPSIKDAWSLNELDTNMLFTAIRIATYGNTISVTHTCSKCNTPNDYELDLSVIIEHFASRHYESKIVFQDLTVNIKPLTYKQLTDHNLKIYELQKRVQQANAIENEDEKSSAINKLWEELAAVQLEMNANHVESVETPTVTVTEREFIVEWLKNCEKDTVDRIKEQVEYNRKQWSVPDFKVECNEPDCKNPGSVLLELDNSNFFV